MVKGDLSTGSRPERKKEETRTRIIDTAMKLFKKIGFEATTMEQIAEEADVARRTLYNHFPVKEAIIDAFIKRAFHEKNPGRMLQLQKMPDTRSRMIGLITELTEGVQQQKEIFEKFLVYRMQNMVSFHQDESVKSGLDLLITEIIVLGQKNAEIRKDIPLPVLVDLFEFVFIEVVKQLYMKPETFNADEVIERSVDLFINGVKKE